MRWTSHNGGIAHFGNAVVPQIPEMIGRTSSKGADALTMLIAYHGDPDIKSSILAQLKLHRESDELVKGRYWENSKGCAVGCTVYSGDHAEYESRFGIPQILAWLEDVIFEGLTNADAKQWPERFMGAIAPGADLSLVGWKFLHWLLTDEIVNPGIKSPEVRQEVQKCADVLVPLTKGLPLNESAERCAENAAWSASNAARAASVESVAWSAESAKSCAESVESVASAWNAARCVASAWSAESAEWSAARSAAYKLMSDHLIELIEECDNADGRDK